MFNSFDGKWQITNILSYDWGSKLLFALRILKRKMIRTLPVRPVWWNIFNNNLLEHCLTFFTFINFSPYLPQFKQNLFTFLNFYLFFLNPQTSFPIRWMLHSPVRSHKTLLSEICQEKQCCMLAVLTALLLYSGWEAAKLSWRFFWCI